MDRAPIIRHVAIILAAVTAYVLRTELQIGNGVLWVLGATASLNFIVYFLAGRDRAGRLSRTLSPFLGLAGWSALVGITGGVRSPFIAGFWLEMALSPMTFRALGILGVAGGAGIGLWSQQVFLGFSGSVIPMVLHTAFLLAAGALTYSLTRRWRRAHGDLIAEDARLRARLTALEKDLERVRTLGKVGENVARLAHGLKNAVHSLRGFAGLIETGLARDEESREALRGLRTSIDHLEELARITLGRPGSAQAGIVALDGPRLRRTLEEVVWEVSAGFPGIEWVKQMTDPVPRAAIPCAALCDILGVLLRNAAEAMGGSGRIALDVGSEGSSLRIRVRDQGGGVPAADLAIFEPGYTTKPEGSGFGLYLAGRLAQAHGGTLAATADPGGGSVFSLVLPAWREASQ